MAWSSLYYGRLGDSGSTVTLFAAATDSGGVGDEFERVRWRGGKGWGGREEEEVD